MKKGRLQAKDITDEECIQLCLELQAQEKHKNQNVRLGHALCERYPGKLVVAKMDSLERRGIVTERHGFGPLYGYCRIKEVHE